MYCQMVRKIGFAFDLDILSNLEKVLGNIHVILV